MPVNHLLFTEDVLKLEIGGFTQSNLADDRKRPILSPLFLPLVKR